MARRGAYAKGVAKREEILARALEVVAREGYRGASVKELAEAVELSQAGLLHYFDSKEQLFTEILRKRDEIDSASLAPDGVAPAPGSTDLRAGYLRVIRHNTEVPGLVQLFSRMAVDAADPEHPAHRYFLQRGDMLRRTLAASLAARMAGGELTTAVDPDTLARVFQAVADGLQLQWMLEPDVDMAAIVEALFTALSPDDRSTGPDPAPTVAAPTTPVRSIPR